MNFIIDLKFRLLNHELPSQLYTFLPVLRQHDLSFSINYPVCQRNDMATVQRENNLDSDHVCGSRVLVTCCLLRYTNKFLYDA